VGGEEQYKVERIVNHRHHGRNKKLQYLVKWKQYPESDNTWELAKDVHAPALTKAYHRHSPLSSIKARALQWNKICPSWSRNPHKSPSSPTLLALPPIAPVLSQSISSTSSQNSPSDISSTSSQTSSLKAISSNTLASAETTVAYSTPEQCLEHLRPPPLS
jgi:Chromo (CHRromatin Organisation MOdifier) domain